MSGSMGLQLAVRSGPSGMHLTASILSLFGEYLTAMANRMMV
jgi:hypothetical protein